METRRASILSLASLWLLVAIGSVVIIRRIELRNGSHGSAAGVDDFWSSQGPGRGSRHKLQTPPRSDSRILKATSGSPAPPYPREFPDEICNASKTDFRSASGLFAIATGCEHSGTTLMSELLMSVPNLFGGFEGGLLIARRPEEFDGEIMHRVNPFDKWMMEHWGLKKFELDWLRKTKCHAEMYAQLKLVSPLFRPPNHDCWILDKTPRYIYMLREIMDRTPGVPVIVTRKPREAQIEAFLRHNPGKSIQFARGMVDAADEGLQQAKEKYPERILEVDMVELVNEVDSTMTHVFDFLGLEWVPDYTKMELFNEKATAVGRETAGPFRRDRLSFNVSKSESGA